MKKYFLFIFISFVLCGSIFAKYKTPGKICVGIEPSPSIAGNILDWCEDVTCQKCVEYDPQTDVTIYTTECWSNC